MENVQWVVQRNLTNGNDVSSLENACKVIGVQFIGVDVIPFTPDLPEFDRRKRSIFYGPTTFNGLAAADPSLSAGVFLDAELFSITRYIQEWGEHMLNYGSKTMTFEELIKEEVDPKKLLFIRPDDDGKAFAGEVIEFGEIIKWFDRLRAIENSGISPDSKIIVGEPYQIGREWRLWCVNKKVIAASQYRNNFKLEKKIGCPEAVAAFAETLCLTFTPHDVFVMDICECGDKFYIVECNCMNAAGFYHADVEAIVNWVTNYFAGLAPAQE